MIRVKGQQVGEVKSWDLRSDWIADWDVIEALAEGRGIDVDARTMQLSRALLDLRHGIQKIGESKSVLEEGWRNWMKSLNDVSEDEIVEGAESETRDDT